MAKENIDRRKFLKAAVFGATSNLIHRTALGVQTTQSGEEVRKPNLVYILADQWRAQAAGYAGNSDVRTPNLDSLSGESINLTNAVSGCPVCSPYRASLMTGRYPLTNGVFVNDVYLNTDAVSIAQAYNKAEYDTGLIGKWHLDGHGSRNAFIPRERRQGFKFWKALECTHDYNNSYYYGDENIKLKWDGYDAIAQIQEARKYIREHRNGKPFALFLMWGPPHAPYLTAPPEYRKLYRDRVLKLLPNVPEERRFEAQRDIAGYYAHIAALDDCVGEILQVLNECGLESDTILVFTSDHGDMLYSHNQIKKQQPWEESIRVPFLLRYPAVCGKTGKEIDMPINTPDIMPTLLGLSSVEIPDTVDGKDYSDVLSGKDEPYNDAVLLSCPHPFGQWIRKIGGKEFRGVRTRRFTYTRDLNGPWLLFDNERDPCQINNLCNRAEYAGLQKRLESKLVQLLEETHDDFLPGMEYIRKWGYKVDENGTVPYTW